MDIREKLISRIPQGWGNYVSCDSGWDWILEELEEKLNHLDSNYEVHQVKEKFGTLRFYFSTRKEDIVSDIMDDCVSHAEYLSAHTCESCGKSAVSSKPGFDFTVKLRGKGWVKTLCNQCAIKLNYPTDEEIGGETIQAIEKELV
jgi:hypothetical protein